MEHTPAGRLDAKSALTVVGIGASAGGLEALERFFANVSPGSGLAYVVVQHLSPDFKSLMSELLARHTVLPIHQVENGTVVEPDHVYLLPARREMILADGRLLLSERQAHELSLPIDVFFTSLGRELGANATAVVLSGSGSDGSRGILEVHTHGGLAIVQDPSTAQFDGMPRAAIETGVADWTLRPEEMPRIIQAHANGLASRTPSGHALQNEALAAGGLETVYRVLQDEFGIDFTHYKPTTVTRRLDRRLRLAQSEHVGEYLARIREDRSELDALYHDLLIGVTRFFRNEEAFDLLAERVLPSIVRKTPETAPVRVWVAGCATGEEAYSLAMLFHERMDTGPRRPVKIFATDVHRGSLEIASRGVYDEAALANVSKERRERFFREKAGAFQIVPELREMLVFAPHNVIRDAPFTRVDLVTCRNLLIYLQPAAQQKALGLFHFALERGGYLFLGPSETPGAIGPAFETIDRHWRIHRKLPDARLAPRSFKHARAPEPRPVATTAKATTAGMLAIYDELLDAYMPSSLLVSESGELVHAFAGASKFLALRDGRPKLDVREVVGDELRVVLVGGIQRAARSSAPIELRGVRARPESDERYDIVIRRVSASSSAGGHLLVTFTPAFAVETPAEERTEIALVDVSRDRVVMMEAELSHAKESLQAAIEELQTSNEELQAANEELLASNEELQSTNEELQSVNEELYTVNAEYQRKITELTELTNDMDNLLSSTDVGTLFLDKKLAIRKFTPRIGETFDLLAQDVGRPIAAFAPNIRNVALAADLERVLETGEPVEREVRDRHGSPFYMRILPYRAKGMVEGVVLTLIDTRGLKAAEDALFHERYLLNSLLFSVRDPIYFKDVRARFIRANHALALWLGIDDPAEAVGKTAAELVPDDPAFALDEQDELVLRGGEPQHERLERRVRRDGAIEWNLVTRLPLRDRTGGIVGVAGIFRNVTDQKRAEERIQEAVRRRDQFLAMLSHELRNPLGAIVTATSLLRQGARTPERSDRLLGIVERQSTQMARLMDDLLEVSRVTQNKIELKRRVVDLGAVSRDAAEAVRVLFDSRSVALAIAIEPRPLYVDGDAARLQQIQVNLLNNAAKYTPPGGHVRLEVRRDGASGVVVVHDDGVGIASEMRDSIFELFVQSRRTLDRSEGGIGVGLTLVRSLVEMHGGSVEVQSDGEGRGAMFTVRLPLVDRPTGDDDSKPRIGPHLPENARIAIVEDSVDSCEMLCELLSAAGFECESANDGISGLALVERMRPDVAILDVGLPGLDGFSIARRLREDRANDHTYLIALTGYGQPTDRAEAREAGFDEHIVKPVRPDRLLELLGRPRTLRPVPVAVRDVDGAPPAPEAES